MKKSARVTQGLLAVGIVGAILLGSLSAVASAARIRPCYCPDVYMPVLCPNGQTYSNSCVASCNGQTGCRRIDDI